MLTIRRGFDGDGDRFIALIGSCWAEYPGCVMDVDGENPELRALASHYAAKGGALWAAEAAGAVVGMIAVAPSGAGIWEIGRMYVDRAWRGAGLASDLLTLAVDHARGRGAREAVLFSDTRFARAHGFYEKQGFVRAGGIRVLNDKSHSLEFRYIRPLAGVAVRLMDAAGAASAERALASVLVAVVARGEAVSFLPPLAEETARAFWRARAKEVAGGTRVLLAGWVDGVLAGSVSLDLATPPNQPHRAEVQKLLVDPAARRRGLARALMAAVEAAARDAGRSLLTLDTRAGDAAELLYRDLGYHEAGRIPRFALNADGSRHDTTIFRKELA